MSPSASARRAQERGGRGAHSDLDGGKVIDLTHTSTVDGTHLFVEPDDQVSLDVALTFTNLAPADTTVTLSGSPTGELTGSIAVDGEEIGVVASGINLPDVIPVTWGAGCD